MFNGYCVLIADSSYEENRCSGLVHFLPSVCTAGDYWIGSRILSGRFYPHDSFALLLLCFRLLAFGSGGGGGASFRSGGWYYLGGESCGGPYEPKMKPE